MVPETGEGSPREQASENHPPDARLRLFISEGAARESAWDEPMEGSSDGGPSYTPTQEIFLPVVGFVELSEAELAVAAHPAIQRLRWVTQLGLSVLVFPGAAHSRLEHTYGTVGIAAQMIDLLQKRHDRSRGTAAKTSGLWRLDVALTSTEIAFIRLAALTHDIGHLPFGHTFEDELGLLDKHDSIRRLESVMDRTKWNGEEGRSLRTIIDSEYAEALSRLELPFTASEVLLFLIRDENPPRDVLAMPGIRWRVCRALVSDTLCADLLDYLHRDRHHLGMPQHFSTRVASYLEIRRRRGSAESRLVVNLQTRNRPRTDAVTELLYMLQQRHELFEVVFYHRTKLAATSMLERALAELREMSSDREAFKEGLLDQLLDCGDIEVLGVLERDSRSRSEQALRDGDRITASSYAAVVRLLVALRQRRLHKTVFDKAASQLPSTVRDEVRRLYAGENGAEARLSTARKLEESFGFSRGSVSVYCPEQPRSKVAAVDVLVDDAVRSLQEHEDLVRLGESTTDLTAGMLQALQRRFASLWRVLVLVDRRELERLGRGRGVLDEMLLSLFKLEGQSRDVHARGAEFAEALARGVPGSPLYGRQADIDPALVLSRRGPVGMVATFPDGTPVPTAYLSGGK